MTFLFGRLSSSLVMRLGARNVPLVRGVAIVGTHVPHNQAVLDIIEGMGYKAEMEYNRGGVMAPVCDR